MARPHFHDPLGSMTALEGRVENKATTPFVHDH